MCDNLSKKCSIYSLDCKIGLYHYIINVTSYILCILIAIWRKVIWEICCVITVQKVLIKNHFEVSIVPVLRQNIFQSTMKMIQLPVNGLVIFDVSWSQQHYRQQQRQGHQHRQLLFVLFNRQEIRKHNSQDGQHWQQQDKSQQQKHQRQFQL